MPNRSQCLSHETSIKEAQKPKQNTKITDSTESLSTVNIADRPRMCIFSYGRMTFLIL